MKQTFAEEKKAIEDRIWKMIGVQNGTRILDIGIGENAASTNRLIGLGAQVTGVDKNFKALSSKEEIDADMVCADVSSLPFKEKVFDLSMAFFTMHEVSANLHSNVFIELVRTSNRIAIVEPNPGEDELYSRYWHILNKAGKSVGECEIYQDITYWVNCLKQQNATIHVGKKISHKHKLIGSDSQEFFQRISKQLIDYGIADQFLNELRELSREVEKGGMLFSDISVIIADSP